LSKKRRQTNNSLKITLSAALFCSSIQFRKHKVNFDNVKPFVCRFKMLTGWLWRLYKLVMEAIQIGYGGYTYWLWRLYKLVMEAIQIGYGGYTNWLWGYANWFPRLCKLVVEAMQIFCGGYATVPSFLYIYKHVDISAGALRTTASLFSTRENVHWQIHYYPQGSPVRVDISAGDFLWKFTVSLRTPSGMSTV
jgi:hypothetical protein